MSDTGKMIDDFDKGRLEEIDQQFKQIEAIKNYDAVKEELDEVKKVRDDIKDKFAEASEKIRKYEASTPELIRQTHQVEEKVENFRRENRQLRQRVQELEDLKITVLGGRAGAMEATTTSSSEVTESSAAAAANGAEKTVDLAELEKVFLKSKEEEIKRKAEEFFNSMKQEWQTGEKSKLVSDAATQSLSNVVEHIVSQGMQAASSKQLEPSSLPAASSSSGQGPSLPVPEDELYSKVRPILESGVKKKLDSEFESRVEAESQARAEEKLEQLSQKEWPNYYNQTILPLANDLEQRIAGNVFNFLTGPWKINCKICGALHKSRMLSPEEVESLISNRTLELQCYGAYLRSQINWGDNILGVAHSFRIALIELIQDKLEP